MNCQDIASILDDQDVRQLSASQRQAAEAHLAGCPECAGDWHAHTSQARRPIPDMPSDIPARVWRRIEATIPPVAPRRRIARPALLAGLVLVGAAAAAIVVMRAPDDSADSGESVADALAEEPSIDAATAEPATATTSTDADGAPAAATVSVEPGGAASTTQDAGISLDLTSVAVLPAELVNSDSESLLALVNDVRADIISRIGESDRLNLIDPAVVQSYIDGGLADIDLGRVLGVGTVVFVRGEDDEGVITIHFGTLDPATDQELYYGTARVADGTLTPEAVRVNALNANNLISRLTLAAYPDLVPSTEQSIDTNRAIALNSALSESERVDAIAELRSLGSGARTDAIVAAAIELATNSDDPLLRNRAWFTLSDVDNVAVIQPLLNTLRYDASAIVRGVAVRLLGEYVDEPGVQEALRIAATEDADPGIRERAATAALTEDERFAQARARFLDTSLPVDERVGALQAHFGSIGPGLPIDTELADALFEIELDPEAGTTWAGTMLYYAEELDPKFIDPLLELLTGDPENRAVAAGLLGHFNDHPAVVEALERALADPDRNVRNNAQRALERTP